MGKSSDGVKANMSATKDKIVDTVGELKANLTDSASDARDQIAGTTSDLRSKVSDTADALGDRAKAIQSAVADRLPDAGGAPNVLPILIGSALVGLAAGLLVPLSEIEKERLQPIGDELARAAVDARREVVSQGQAVVVETITAAKQSARTHGQEVAEHLGMTEQQTSTNAGN
jgi:hypothetical protein